jgi:hypothetical protein
MDDRYPIGKYVPIGDDPKALQSALMDLLHFPRKLEISILDLDADQLDTPYREGGWTVTQLVHHMADSHMNAYIRCKLGLTEDHPVIKPYNEAAWAELADVRTVPINMSLTLLHALHARWHALFSSLDDSQWARTVVHPETKRTLSIRDLAGIYAWHGNHHVAHVNNLRDRMGWW